MKVKIDGKLVECERADYVKSKTKQLVEFGYAGLTEQHVDEQISALIVGKEFGAGLTIIGMFMKDEVIGGLP